MQITVVRSGSSCPLGEVLEHSEKVGPGGGGVAYIYIYIYKLASKFKVPKRLQNTVNTVKT